MNIYFAGSIRGGREDRDRYAEIIALLRAYGTILTEHVGDEALSSYGQTHMTDEEIYTKDTAMIRGSDIVIAEVTTPSLGVGYELGYAESLGKRVLCLYREREGSRLSAMIAGDSYFKVVTYQTVAELETVFKSELSNP